MKGNHVSAYQIGQAMAVANAVRSRILSDDPDAAEDHQLIADVIDGETDAIDIVRSLVRFSIEAQSLADAADERIKALRERKARFERRVETARGTAFAMLQALEFGGKLEEPDFTASISRGRPSVRITNEELLPDAFVRTRREPDKTAIKAAIDSGETVQGAELSNGAPTLVLRVK